MSRIARTSVILVSIMVVSILAAGKVFANGGPFVIKYPNGDPAAKGVLARLDPDLMPGRESRLKVVKEDLKVTFDKDRILRPESSGPPLVHVSAQYTIENPTDQEIEVDFGFPILRGIYVSPYSMMPRPDVVVQLDQKPIVCTIISNSTIYGIIRQRAYAVIEEAIAADAELANLVSAVRNSAGEERLAARQKLSAYMTGQMKWNQRDAALLIEYVSLDVKGQIKIQPPDHTFWWANSSTEELHSLESQYLGSLAAIGEQKVTQLFAHLASKFNLQAAAAYEKIFAAWGGDVRECSVDLSTGKVRPREISVDPAVLSNKKGLDIAIAGDPTIYARVDYLDPNAPISEIERASCEAILKNLPVIFTFAPMNILHYQVKFPANSIHTLTVGYTQYAYLDTHEPSSYQLAYVVHPASLWKEFGPINLEVAVPDGVGFRASVACDNGGYEERQVSPHNPQKVRFGIYRTILEQKTGELYLAVDAKAWKGDGKQVAVESQNNQVNQSAHLAIAGVKPNN